MAPTSPLSPAFARGGSRPRNRSTLLWFGGHSGHADARTQMFKLHSAERDFVLLDSLKSKQRLDAINMSLTSAFCWVPRGQGQGDPTRHMVAIFHGCVPVFTLGHRGDDDALPFDELLPWPKFSLRVPTDELRSLPAVLRRASSDAAAVDAMRAELACAWRALFWTSLHGSCFGEAPRGDAFDAMMAVLRRRLLRKGVWNGAPPTAASACDVGGPPPLRPSHLH